MWVSRWRIVTRSAHPRQTPECVCGPDRKAPTAAIGEDHNADSGHRLGNRSQQEDAVRIVSASEGPLKNGLPRTHMSDAAETSPDSVDFLINAAACSRRSCLTHGVQRSIYATPSSPAMTFLCSNMRYFLSSFGDEFNHQTGQVPIMYRFIIAISLSACCCGAEGITQAARSNSLSLNCRPNVCLLAWLATTSRAWH